MSEAKELTSDERLQWLRERGILVETPEERRAKAIISIMKEPDPQITTPPDEQMERMGLTNPPSVCQKEIRFGVDGSHGKSKHEDGYSWTQTEKELEVVIPLSDTNVTSKEVQVAFKPRQLQVRCRSETLIGLTIFESIEVEGSTWELQRDMDVTKLVLTMEKTEQALWLRFKD